jgi:hypothetical protein
MPETLWQNRRRRDHRAGERAASRFIDPGDANHA